MSRLALFPHVAKYVQVLSRAFERFERSGIASAGDGTSHRCAVLRIVFGARMRPRLLMPSSTPAPALASVRAHRRAFLECDREPWCVAHALVTRTPFHFTTTRGCISDGAFKARCRSRVRPVVGPRCVHCCGAAGWTGIRRTSRMSQAACFAIRSGLMRSTCFPAVSIVRRPTRRGRNS